MRLSYHHANPESGNESFLLRYQADPATPGGSCVLVDAGDGTDVDDLLAPADDLVAICVTHAHLDHYQALDDCWREGVPIYTSTPTAALLDDVFDVAARDYDVTTQPGVSDSITGIAEWTTLAPGLEVHPVPAGHVPGAVGYLFRVDDGDTTHHALATGDFTARRAAGYPGFQADSLLDIDVLFLTAATATGFEDNLSEALGRALQRAHSGAQTLVTTSGLVGVQVAYLLDALGQACDSAVPITVVGQVAKLYETLDYECRRVETVPYFEDPQTCLQPGTITIAGPEVPHERSSGRLFGLLRSDPGACVIQLLGGSEDPLEGGRCTIEAYELVNHPAKETLTAVHDTIAPQSTVITHRHRGAGAEFNDLDSAVWSPTDSDEYTLYADGQWLAPPWMGQQTLSPAQGSMGQHFDDGLLGALSLPSLARHDNPDLPAEGLDVTAVERILAQQEAYHDPADEPATDAEPSPTDATTFTGAGATSRTPTDTPAEDNTMTDTTDTDSSEASDAAERPPTLVDSTARDVDGIDERLLAAVENGQLEIEDLVKAREAAQQRAAGEHETDAPEADETTTATAAGGETDDTATATDPVSEDGDTAASQSTSDGEATRTDAPTAEADTATDATSEDEELPDHSADAAEAAAATGSTASTDGSDAIESASTTTQTTDQAATDHNADEAAVSITLSPLTVALAHRARAATDAASVEAVVTTAVQEYLHGVLADEIEPPATSPTDLEVTGGGTLPTALAAVVDQDETVDDVAALMRAALADEIAPKEDLETTLVLPELTPFLPLLDGVAANERYGVGSRSGVIALAVQHAVHTTGEASTLAPSTEDSHDVE